MGVWDWRLRGGTGGAEVERVVIPEFAERMSGTQFVSADVWVPDRFSSGMTRCEVVVRYQQNMNSRWFAVKAIVCGH